MGSSIFVSNNETFDETKSAKVKIYLKNCKHGDIFYLNDDELYLALNKPVYVIDTNISTTQKHDNKLDSSFSQDKSLIAILIHTFINKYLFHQNSPTDIKPNIDSPFKYNLFNYEELFLITKDSKKLHSYFIKQPKTNRNSNHLTILYFHGNHGNIGTNLKYVKNLYIKLNCNVLLIDYRGYGYSSYIDGKGMCRNNEYTCYLDAKAGLDYLYMHRGINLERVCVLG